MRKRLSDEQAKALGFKVRKRTEKASNPKYYLNAERVAKYQQLFGNEVTSSSKTSANDYHKKTFVLSAWNAAGYMMDIDEYCDHYKLPREDITSYKLVSHTGTPFYNIVFKENITEQLQDFDFEAIIKQYIKPITVKKKPIKTKCDFDVLTYTDLHVGMDTNKTDNSMYAEKWDAEAVMYLCETIINTVRAKRQSEFLVVDDLGDLLDGYDGKTTRGGHDLPQNMTNEQAFDCALQFKMMLLDGLAPYYRRISFNNVCNDNHAGSFGYFVNKAFKELAETKYNGIKVTNHRTFLSHYYVNDVAFIISHGKDDKTLKFGFKPQLDTKQIEKIDQYCKHNDIYAKSKRIVFKKGDSHQALFDMCTSDDFDYYNYPAASPSSQWVQNNFKKGRKGFVLEYFTGLTSTLDPYFE